MVAQKTVTPANNTDTVIKVKQGKLTFYYGVEQGTQAWLDLRSQLVTCSNSLALCYKGGEHAREINRQHAKRTTPNESKYTLRGHILEDEIREKLEEVFNNDTQELVSCSFITNEDYIGAGYSPDGIIRDKKTGEFIAPIEIKCFNDVTENWNRKTHMYEKKVTNKHKSCCESVENIPLENRMQFEMEMLITETEQLVVVLYNPEADIEHGVPILKIHTYTPEKFHDKDGNEVYAYRERVKERLLGK